MQGNQSTTKMPEIGALRSQSGDIAKVGQPLLRIGERPVCPRIIKSPDYQIVRNSLLLFVIGATRRNSLIALTLVGSNIAASGVLGIGTGLAALVGLQ
jgi:hypothetical protein